jgi:prepilin-type N-terminal cleavage/methylation domain-containing protein/prepilin-type processing-associated H-X9-DG protein
MPSLTFRKRRAFTLLELVVVLAIIGVLLALVLPAVMKVQEAASRAACTNNLKQLALALHDYHDTNGSFSCGQFLGPYGTGPNSRAWSWLARLLPFIEQQNLSQSGGIPVKTLAASGVLADQVPLLFCPSDNARSRGVTERAGNLDGVAVGLTNYKAVSGANWGMDFQGNKWVRLKTDWTNRGTNGSNDGLDYGDGMMYRSDSAYPLRFRDVTDGSSNTFMLGEDVPALNDWCTWPYSNNAYGTCAIPPNVRPPGGGSYNPNDWQNTWSFRSRHPGGLNFALADGSVHFVPNAIDLAVYRALATVSGGEMVSVP